MVVMTDDEIRKLYFCHHTIVDYDERRAKFLIEALYPQRYPYLLLTDKPDLQSKVTKNNRLSDDNIARIVSAVAERSETAHFSHLAAYDEVAGNDYNLSVSTYVEAEDTREKIDIRKLNPEIEEIVARENVLRAEIAAIIREIEVAE